MRITLINTLYAPYAVGGAEKSVQALAEWLAEEGHEVAVVCCGPQKGVEVRMHNGVRVYELGLKNLYWPFGANSSPLKPLWHAIDSYNPAMAAAVSRILRQERPDIVHTNNIAGFSVAIWSSAAALHIPLVHTIRDYYLLCPKTTMFKNGKDCTVRCFDCRMYSEPRSRSTVLVDAVVGISNFVLQRHTQAGLFHSSQKTVIYNSFVPSRPAPLRPKSPRLKFGYLGRLTSTKGIEALLRSTQLLSSSNWTLRIGGQGEPSYINFLQDAYQDDRIEYLGFTDAESFLAAIDVLIVPSLWHEPMGRVVVEAFAHGVPVIGSIRGGIPELITDGKTGFSFEPDDPESLVRVISRFTDDIMLASSMYDACIEQARSFQPSVIGPQYLDAYTQAKHRAGRRQKGQH